MNNYHKSIQSTKLIQCKVCLKEIPKSAAKSFEGEDYIWHFCGKNCYAKWQEQVDIWLSGESDANTDENNC